MERQQRQRWIQAVMVVCTGFAFFGLVTGRQQSENALVPSTARRIVFPEAKPVEPLHTTQQSTDALPYYSNDGTTGRRYGTYQPAPTVYYSCVHNGHRVFSDSPCGPNAAPQRLDPERLNHYSAPPPVAVRSVTVDQYAPSPITSVTRSDNDEGWTAPLCRSLEKTIAGIDSRMRSGYGGPEGESLRSARRAATAEYHRRHCHKF